MNSNDSPASPLVTLVIPGRNCAKTIGRCLDAAVTVLNNRDSRLASIIFVDDGSTDDTATIARARPDVRVVKQPGRGPAAARNAGWRASDTSLIWFIDSDCVTEPDALRRLLPAMDDPSVGGAGGSYGIENPRSALARIIHEEIMARHARMKPAVDFLASFNVLYRRDALETTGGFDERFTRPSVEDADLSFRVQQAGFQLRFDAASRVRHYHPERLSRYLSTQARHGYWRVWLHLEHAGHVAGDSYSSVVDHAQPPLSVLIAASIIPVIIFSIQAGGTAGWLIAIAPGAMGFALFLLQLPMAARIASRAGARLGLLFIPVGFLRAFWRGAGMTAGAFHYFLGRHRRSERPVPAGSAQG